VDDDQAFRERLVKALVSRKYCVQGFASFASSQNDIDCFEPTHAVVDLRIASESGLQFVPYLKEKFNSRVVMLTGYGSVATALEAARLGVVNYLTKPAAVESILQALFGDTLAPVQAAASPVPSLSAVEWEHIQRVLRDCEGNITRAAGLLGMHRQALQRKLKAPPLS